MSYTFEGSFRTKESARRTVMKDPGLPDVVREVLLGGINALSYDTDDRYLYVKAVGHQMDGADSYERTNALFNSMVAGYLATQGVTDPAAVIAQTDAFFRGASVL